MLSLSALTDKIINSYTSLIIERAKNRRDDTANAAVGDYFTDDRIYRILIDKPANLLTHHTNYLNFFFPHSTEVNFFSYLDALKKQEKSRTENEIDLINLFDDTTKAVRKIFDYDAFISKSKKVSYHIASLLDRNTCTYCNRQYTLTVSKGKNHLIRPQFDHWYPKYLYPVLALSIYNLIPSCTICNSGIKGSNPFNTREHVHPYHNQDIATRYKFTYGKTDINKNKVMIETNDTSISNTIIAFKLEEVYQAHSDYELKELLDMAKKYNANYIEELINSFDKLHFTREEVYRMVFGIEYDTKDFHKRPFSKFKYDIIKELLKNI